MHPEIFIFLAMFALAAFVAYLYFNSRHKERMSLIESGRDAGLFKGSQDPQYMGALKWGLMLLCVGIGLAIGIFIDISNHHDGPFFTIPLVFGSGGLGLIIYYIMAKAQREEEV